VSRYGRSTAEWDALEAAGWEFLVSQARLQRTTSYTEMNTVLARRTGIRGFDFNLDGERHAMGELLGQLSERSFGEASLLISVLVQYLSANDAGPGFYQLAQRKSCSGRTRPRTRSWPSGSGSSIPFTHITGRPLMPHPPLKASSLDKL